MPKYWIYPLVLRFFSRKPKNQACSNHRRFQLHPWLEEVTKNSDSWIVQVTLKERLKYHQSWHIICATKYLFQLNKRPQEIDSGLSTSWQQKFWIDQYLWFIQVNFMFYHHFFFRLWDPTLQGLGLMSRWTRVMFSRSLSSYDKRRVVVTGLGYLTCLGSGRVTYYFLLTFNYHGLM